MKNNHETRDLDKHTYAVNYIRTIFITPLLHLLDRTMDMGFDAFFLHSFPIRSLCHLPLEEGFVFAIEFSVHAPSHPTTASYSLILFFFPFIWLCRRRLDELISPPQYPELVFRNGIAFHRQVNKCVCVRLESKFHRSQDFEHFSCHDLHDWVRVRCASIA